MKYKYLDPQGFCFGVLRSLKLLDEAILKYPDKQIYLLGLIIHNYYIINKYKKKGVIILDDFPFAKEKNLLNISNSVIVFQAHGSSKSCFDVALANDNIIIDATCPFVKKIHNELAKYVKLNYNVYYIGHANHPETIAALSIPGVKLYDGEIQGENVFVTNQTTLSYYDLEATYENIKRKNPNAILANLICTATRDRQKALLEDQESDFYIVVGDQKSSNSRRLYELALTKKPALFVESSSDIDYDSLKQYNCIGITSGASTPSFLVEEIIANLIDK